MFEFTTRPEAAGDGGEIFQLLAACFPTDAEARLVDALRAAGRLTRAFVAVSGAESGGRIVGYAAVSPVTLDGAPVNALGLGPVAVEGASRRQGVGEAVVRAVLASVEADFVVVLGSPAYYDRFGFKPAYAEGLRDEYNGGDAFQVMGRRTGKGLIQYAPEFAGG